MSKGRIARTTIRFDLDNPSDRIAWERIQCRDRRLYPTQSKAVINAVNECFERQERLRDDPYLETREKEDAFLQKVLDTIETGLHRSSTGGVASVLLQFLQGAVSLPTASTETDSVSEEQQEAESAALDFIEGF